MEMASTLHQNFLLSCVEATIAVQTSGGNYNRNLMFLKWTCAKVDIVFSVASVNHIFHIQLLNVVLYICLLSPEQLSSGISAVCSPRLSPDQCRIVYLECSVYGPHMQCNRLCMVRRNGASFQLKTCLFPFYTQWTLFTESNKLLSMFPHKVSKCTCFAFVPAYFTLSMTGTLRRPQWWWMWWSDLVKVRYSSLSHKHTIFPEWSKFVYLKSFFCVGVQMASLASMVVRCHHSAGRLTVSVLSLLVLSVAARYGQLLQNVMKKTQDIERFLV